MKKLSVSYQEFFQKLFYSVTFSDRICFFTFMTKLFNLNMSYLSPISPLVMVYFVLFLLGDFKHSGTFNIGKPWNGLILSDLIKQRREGKGEQW